MKWCVFLKDNTGWFLFKAFGVYDKALRSHTSFRSSGFDCLLVMAVNKEHLEQVKRIL